MQGIKIAAIEKNLSVGALVARQGRWFVGGSQYLSSKSVLNPNILTGDFTFATWVMDIDNTSGQNRQFFVNGSHVFYQNNSTYTYYDGGIHAVTGNIPTNHHWDHLAVVRRAGVVSGFFNGVYTQYISTDVNWPNGNTLYVGSSAAGYAWQGGLADYALWGQALSPNDIARLADGYSPAEFRDRKPVLYFPFDGNDLDYYGRIFLTATGSPYFVQGPALRQAKNRIPVMQGYSDYCNIRWI